MSDRTIELGTTVEAQPEAVLRALTDAGELARWFPSAAESDPRTGGAYNYSFEFETDTSRNHTYAGVYREVSSGRVAYGWKTAAGPTEVEFRIAPSGDGTEIRLVHSGWAEHEDDAVEEFRQGWGFFLENLKAYLERGEDARASTMGMRTPAAV
jgi:uncharacterized protein YndB with AHSA1/START domain